MPKILVTGGTGYIGSHTCIELDQRAYEPLIIDNQSRSFSWIDERLKEISGKTFVSKSLDLRNKETLSRFFDQHEQIDGIIHFAAFKTVPESVREPLLYFENNIVSLLNLLEETSKRGIPKFVFSSSCSVYGNPEKLPVTEETPFGEAESPYARTKQIGEEIIRDFSKVYEGKISILRYFNPVGSHASGRIGDLPIGVPDNLVPYITQTAIGKRQELTIFGNDYPTLDGTCIRDYIHVVDIAIAHIKALEFLDRTDQKVSVHNLGSGEGVSVKQVVDAFIRSTGEELPHVYGERRPGDVVEIYANNEKAKKDLLWEPRLDLDEMMRSAWVWEKNLRMNNWLEE